MVFHKEILKIKNIQSVAHDLQEFIKNEIFTHYKKRGIVIGLSGGIDSAVVASLAVKAIGNEKVLGIILPEKDSNTQSQKMAQSFASDLNIKTEFCDITQILESYGIYKIRDDIVKKYYPKFDKSTKYRIRIPNTILENNNMRIPYLEIKSGNILEKYKISSSDFSTIIAATTMKLRTRMNLLYFYAEKNNYIVSGTTNKTETMLGYFVKYGDGGVDIEPQADLFKTQVYQLAEYLNIPKDIIERKASPDTWSFETSDEEFFFGLPYNMLDIVLFGLENKVSINEIANILDHTEEQIKRIIEDTQKKIKSSEHLRKMPPKWIASNILIDN